MQRYCIKHYLPRTPDWNPSSHEGARAQRHKSDINMHDSAIAVEISIRNAAVTNAILMGTNIEAQARKLALEMARGRANHFKARRSIPSSPRSL